MHALLYLRSLYLATSGGMRRRGFFSNDQPALTMLEPVCCQSVSLHRNQKHTIVDHDRAVRGRCRTLLVPFGLRRLPSLEWEIWRNFDLGRGLRIAFWRWRRKSTIREDRLYRIDRHAGCGLSLTIYRGPRGIMMTTSNELSWTGFQFACSISYADVGWRVLLFG